MMVYHLRRVSDVHYDWKRCVLCYMKDVVLHCSIFCKWNKIVRVRWRLKSPASRLFTQPFIQAQIKENIKAPRHWPLWGEFTDDRWIPRAKGQQRGNVFIWWRLHETCMSFQSFHCACWWPRYIDDQARILHIMGPALGGMIIVG